MTRALDRLARLAWLGERVATLKESVGRLAE